jgi:hypothetical protein
MHLAGGSGVSAYLGACALWREAEEKWKIAVQMWELSTGRLLLCRASQEGLEDAQDSLLWQADLNPCLARQYKIHRKSKTTLCRQQEKVGNTAVGLDSY